jgi:hypothetical protein
MSQSSVYEFLKKNKNKWYTNRQVAGETGASVASVTNNTSKLIKSKFLDSKVVKVNKYKRIMYRAR